MPVKWDDAATAALLLSVIVVACPTMNDEQKKKITSEMQDRGYDVNWNGIRYIHSLVFLLVNSYEQFAISLSFWFASVKPNPQLAPSPFSGFALVIFCPTFFLTSSPTLFLLHLSQHIAPNYHHSQLSPQLYSSNTIPLSFYKFHRNHVQVARQYEGRSSDGALHVLSTQC